MTKDRKRPKEEKTDTEKTEGGKGLKIENVLI